jgi:hydrogenase/urease accessory protein HupE
VRRLFWWLPLLAFCSRSAIAHEMRPAYLQLRQTNANTYEIFWKVPALGDSLRLSLYVQLPSACSDLTAPRGFFSGGAYSERWNLECEGGLPAKTIRINGLTATLTDVLVRIERLDGSTQVTRLTSSSPAFVVEAAPHRTEVARTYLVLGVEHILTGVDHLLFVSGLLLLVNGFKRLIQTISAFTLSHSVTLTLATLGFVHVPQAPVEAVIALSILFVAYEVLRSREKPQRLAQQKPWLVAFTFGLLHGLGFAGGLHAAGLPTGHIPLALAFFSMGVEIGHFSFVTTALVLISATSRWATRLPVWSWRLPPYAIGTTASYWLIARLAAY